MSVNQNIYLCNYHSSLDKAQQKDKRSESRHNNVLSHHNPDPSRSSHAQQYDIKLYTNLATQEITRFQRVAGQKESDKKSKIISNPAPQE